MRDSSNSLVDPLSDLLNFLQVRCDLSGRLVAGGTWARCFTNLDAIKFCAVTKGVCWYSIDGMLEPARVDTGDVLITNGTLTLASAAALIPNRRPRQSFETATISISLAKGATSLC